MIYILHYPIKYNGNNKCTTASLRQQLQPTIHLIWQKYTTYIFRFCELPNHQICRRQNIYMKILHSRLARWKIKLDWSLKRFKQIKIQLCTWCTHSTMEHNMHLIFQLDKFHQLYIPLCKILRHGNSHTKNVMICIECCKCKWDEHQFLCEIIRVMNGDARRK